MTIFNVKTIMTSFALMSLLTLSACNSTAKTSVNQSCENISSVNLTDAVNTAQMALQSGQCNHKFADYYQELLTVAKGSPEKNNKRVFDKFINWSHNNKVISKLDAKLYFSRYFSERFMSLNSTYNICSQSAKQDEIFSALSLEMQDKKLGLLNVLNDKNTFNKVARQYSDLQTVLEATWLACES